MDTLKCTGSDCLYRLVDARRNLLPRAQIWKRGFFRLIQNGLSYEPACIPHRGRAEELYRRGRSLGNFVANGQYSILALAFSTGHDGK
jgi:hypothetical protein